MTVGKVTIVGIGPGSKGDMTLSAIEAVKNADAVVGYKYYMQFVEHLIDECRTEVFSSGMKQEKLRVEKAFELAESGKNVCVISSGDAEIYGMAPLVFEMKRDRGSDISLEVISGISSFQKAAALLGAPLSHDFCVISLSDLMTPWSLIEKRIKAAAEADFVTAVFNPKSHNRYWELYRLKEIFLETRNAETPVGYVMQAGREEQKVTITTLGEFDPEQVDMFTVVLIGNSQTYTSYGRMITPRGYFREGQSEGSNAGQAIMIESFRTIEREMRNPDIPLDMKWPLLHAIHTTADFDMENIVKCDSGAVPEIYRKLTRGKVRTIVTDVTMAASGIRKGALQRMGIETVCYINDPEIIESARAAGTTRAVMSIRKAAKEHPDALYVFGNAPTALVELCRLVRSGQAAPAGIIAAPVGFVHVCESKHMVKPFKDIPKIIVEGRKGGSNLAATLVNSILCWPDAEQLKPGRDV